MFKRIWAMGDIHGSYYPIENFWRRNKDSINFSAETDCLILLGDVGANYFFDHRDKNFKKKLNKFPFTYFCIRGNHEERITNVVSKNLSEWHQIDFFNNTAWVEQKYPNIIYAMDCPTVYNINNYNTLIIPGAYSVDKFYRIQHQWSWFKDEQLTQDEMEQGRILLKKYNYNFDLVFSHTCPISYEPTDLFLSVINQATVDKSMERYLGEIEYNITYKLWLWGHYHSYRIYPHFQNSQCIMLSDGEEAINILEWLNDTNTIHKKY